jgi:predicted nuclease of predicted toxin-antitoxin system
MGSILSIISNIFWLIVRGFKRADDPNRIYEKAKAENARIIATHDADALNRSIDAATGRVSGTSGSDIGRP